MTEPKVLREGEFNPKVKAYWLLSPTIALGLSIILIPIIPIYLLIASMVVDRLLAAMKCTLTDRALIIKKGILNRVESTIPLEKSPTSSSTRDP
ncbi:MAG TPA: PH domain-containing protein [Phycisphaerales bacterium]|nr:PH domain-containing protein [Phycisphaerales bacterium]